MDPKYLGEENCCSGFAQYTVGVDDVNDMSPMFRAILRWGSDRTGLRSELPKLDEGSRRDCDCGFASSACSRER